MESNHRPLNENEAAFLLPNGSYAYYKYPDVPRGLKPKRIIFGVIDADADVCLWQSKCKLIINPSTEQPILTPLQLQVGKQYVRRDGEVSGVITRTDNHKTHPFSDGQLTYTLYGRQGYNPTMESNADLISEACINTETGTTVHF